MLLFEISPNIQEPETAGRKRSHDDFSGELIKADLAPGVKASGTLIIQPSADSLLHAVTHNPRHPSSEGSRTLAGHARKSPSPQNPPKDALKQESTRNQQPAAASASSTQPATAVNPPVKRKRLSPEEKAKQEEEKAARTKEREEKRKKKEEEDRIKAEKKQKKEDDDRIKAEKKEEDDRTKVEKKRKKEEDDRVKAEKKRKKEEEKERQARGQKTLGNFFTSTPKKTEEKAVSKDQSPAKAMSATPTAKQVDFEYKKLFKPFFVKENTRLAPAIQMDEETREAKSRILDEHMANQQHKVVPFNPMDIFAFPSKPPPRGKLHQPVKHIMETAYRETQNSGNTGGVDAGRIFNEVRTHLSKIPMKVISFSQDVRPAYYGTITFKIFALGKGNMHRLARRSTGRRLPLDYDYDSEAEWQEEEGEDLDVEDEEEDLDDEDDMDGFLDDSEDVGVSRRLFGNTMEPDSTGICFENQDRQGPNPTVYEHKMEFIHEGLDHHRAIDPFSTQYWEPEPKAAKATKTTKAKASKTGKSSESEAKMPPPRAPANAFAALGGSAGSTAAPVKLVKAELMNDVKRAILDNKALSKVGIVDFIFHQFRDNVSRAEVKNTIEFVAEKKGGGRTKEWELKPGHEIVM